MSEGIGTLGLSFIILAAISVPAITIMVCKGLWENYRYAQDEPVRARSREYSQEQHRAQDEKRRAAAEAAGLPSSTPPMAASMQSVLLRVPSDFLG